MSDSYSEAYSLDPFKIDPDGPVVVRAEKCWLFDKNGQRYFDATGGSGAVNLYHQHPAVQEAIQRQSERLLHTGWNVQSDVRLKLIEKLGEFSPFDNCAILFTLAGTEGIEAALKVARAYTNRKSVISFERAFHGKSTGSLAVTWRKNFKQYVALAPGANATVPYPILHKSEPECGVEYCLDKLEFITEQMCKEGNPPAAIILEPIQTSEGVLAAGQAFLSGVHRIADRFGCVLIYDEIYTGFCRTGRKFCAGNAGMPDLLVLGKGLGNGIPISAVLGNKDILNQLPPGNHSCTFAANPLACEVGSAVIDTMNELKLWEIAAETGKEIKSFLQIMSEEYGCIQNVRGEGLLLAFDCVAKQAEHSVDFTKRFVDKAYKNGMIIRYGGFNGQSVKFTPPLIMGKEEIEFVKACFKKSLHEIC